MSNRNLEAALDSTVVEVKQHRVEYLEACHRPLLTFIQVTPIAVDDIHQSYLESHPPSMKLFERVLDGKGLGRFQVARTLFGPLGQDVFALNFLEARVDHCRAKLPKDDHDILEKTIAGLCQHVEDWQPTLSNCSPKLLMLIEYLLQSQLSELPPQSMIVFCEQRDHAALISRILQCCKRLQPHLRVSYIVGHGETSPIQPIGHKSKEQQVRVADFRSGKLNCIVASQVAEEGLDFRACSLVVRYNLPSTMISLIQSRGRARAANSQLVLFCEGEVEKQKIERFFDDEERSKQFHGQSQDDSDDIELDEPNEDLAVLGVFYPSPSTTTAQITPSTSLRLVNETCQLLPRDEFTLLVKPEYIVEAHDDGYIATLTLPRMKWLPASERVFHSATMASAKSARCHAAFQAVKRLHRRGALDDHLMPIREVDEAANLDASRKRVKLPDPETNEAMPKFVNATAVNPFGSLQGELFLYAVSLSYSITSETTRLGLVCGVSSLTIMPFELDIDGQHCHVSLQPLYQVSWLASGKEFAQVLRFTHAILQAVGDRRHDHETSLWHFIVLLKEASDEIDWDIMNEQISANPSDTEAGEILWAQFNRRLRPSRFLKLIKWRPDLNLENPIPDGTPLYPFDRQTHKFATLRDILTAGLDPPGPGFCCPKDVPEHDPILEAEVLSFPKVGPSSESPSDGVSHTVVLPASVCKRVRIPSQSFALLSAMSHITHNLLSQIQVCQALVRLDLKDTIGLDMAMEALTIPEANCGRDYETLEHVGDAFLKLAVSIHVFNNFNEEAEGYLSKIRSNTTDNRILQKHAQSKNLQASVVCTTVFGSFIQPPKFAKDEIPPDSKLCHQVRGKALADCAEASLGASLCSKGFEAALETAVKLGLSVGGEVPWSLRYTPHPIPTDLNTPPTLYSLEKLLGYHYERPNLALDALRHRSVLSQTSEEACYERLEFLGDAVLE